MKSAFLPLFYALLLCSGSSFGQLYLNLGVDNDLYFGLDRYYSSGIFISIGELKPKAEQKEAYPKAYVLWTLGQEIFTPSLIPLIQIIDYPYGVIKRSLRNTNCPFGMGSIDKVGDDGQGFLSPIFKIISR